MAALQLTAASVVDSRLQTFEATVARKIQQRLACIGSD